MNSNQLSKRLETVASFIRPARTVADIGSDHAYLPCYAVKKNIVDRAIAGEVAEGPFRSAQKQVAADGLAEKVEVRKGNGLAVLSPGEVECIAIAGMGGPLIATILEEGKEKLAGVQTLVLQPNVAAHAVRQWLHDNGWSITAEDILEEDGQLYEIVCAAAGAKQKLSEEDIYFGPFLKTNQLPAFKQKWKRELEQAEQVLQQLSEASPSESTDQRRAELQQKKIRIAEVLKRENT